MIDFSSFLCIKLGRDMEALGVSNWFVRYMEGERELAMGACM